MLAPMEPVSGSIEKEWINVDKQQIEPGRGKWIGLREMGHGNQTRAIN